jgi:hypothetical protein
VLHLAIWMRAATGGGVWRVHHRRNRGLNKVSWRREDGKRHSYPITHSDSGNSIRGATNCGISVVGDCIRNSGGRIVTVASGRGREIALLLRFGSWRGVICAGETAPVLTAVLDSDERIGVEGASVGVSTVSAFVVAFGREGSSVLARVLRPLGAEGSGEFHVW